MTHTCLQFTEPLVARSLPLAAGDKRIDEPR